MRYLQLTLVLLLSIFFIACDDEPTTSIDIDYSIPEVYSDFENVNYDGQLERQAMLLEMKAYINSASVGNPVDSSRLAAMYTNSSDANFSRAYTNQLKDKTFAPEAEEYYTYFGEIARNSMSTEPGAPGVAGFADATTNNRTYILAPNGVEYLQVIEKGLMAATFYYQATSVYLGNDRMTADNEVVEPGIGTALEHHWDEAFGYFGVPQDFPSNVDGVVFWGDYCNDRNELLNTNVIMSSWLKGRAAISNKDEATQFEAIDEVRNAWEKVVASTAVHYLNAAIRDAADPARRAHDLSEAIIFIQALKYNEGRNIDLASIEQIITDLAGSTNWFEMDVYGITDSDIATARIALASTFGFETMAEQL